MRTLFLCSVVAVLCAVAQADAPRVFPEGQRPDDPRLTEVKNLNGYFPFASAGNADDWSERREAIRRRILVSQGLWPMPTKSPLNAVVHGRVERDGYVVDRVFFESIPGHYVTGSLYRPKNKQGPMPAILSPHGHWDDGRMYRASDSQVRSQLASGGERFESAATNPIQARAVQLARMGCIVFSYDMTGYADSIQLGHRPANWKPLDRPQRWGFFSSQAELRLQNMMGLQTWNSIRALDFLLGLDDVDPTRIGVTGASGGGTQSMVVAAIDDRITAAMPCVMVSTAMQGGCTCENAPHLRVGQGNIDIAAAVAPRPLGMTAADDWTIELETKGFPDLAKLYSDLGVKDRLTAAFQTQFKHNYNHVNRVVMYGFFNRHFKLGFDEPILERDFQPLTRDEATVWSDPYQPPSGDAVGDSHEVHILELATEDSEAKMDAVIAATTAEDDVFQSTVGTAWSILLDRTLADVGEVGFEKTGERESDLGKISWGTLTHAQQKLPVAQLDPAGGNAKGTVVWIIDRGKAEFFQPEARETVQQILRSGYRIVTADLLGQGEFTDDGNPVQEQPMWYQRGGETGWQQFSGYTYGYNHSLFAKRVHDVLALLKFAARDDDSPVHLVGTGGQAGAIALAARTQAGDAVAQTFADLDGFRFESLTRQDHPMFVPGAVKYLDVDGLIGLCLPGEVHVVGPPSNMVTRIAIARGAGDKIQWHESAEALVAAMSDALSR